MSRNIMTAEETEHVRQVFTKLDADGNGTLSFEEIRNGFTEHYAMSSEELEDILRIWDQDGSGDIDYSEFITACINRDQMLSNEKLKIAFKLFD